MDIFESIGLLALPAFGMGGVVGGLGSTENVTVGVLVGGLFGAMLMGFRRGFVAVRTNDGTVRKRRPIGEGTVWTRLAGIEYDRVLSVVLRTVAVAAFVAIPLVTHRTATSSSNWWSSVSSGR